MKFTGLTWSSCSKMQIPITVDYQPVPPALAFLKEDIIAVNVEIFSVQFIVQITLDWTNLLNTIQEVYYQEDATVAQPITYNGKRSYGKWEKKMLQGGKAPTINRL